MNHTDSSLSVALRKLCLTAIMFYVDPFKKVCQWLAMKKDRKCNVNMWWWGSRVNDAMQRKKDAFNVFIKNPTEETISKYWRL